MGKNKSKLIVILGPTASGKSGIAVKLAKKFNGEIVSADSRQIYRSLNIGTAKITKKEMAGVPHYLLDVVSPKKRFTVVQYQKLAREAIDKTLKKGKIPILCGGTGFYIQAVVDGITIPEVEPNWKLRKKLEKKTTEELFKKLKKLDPKRARKIDSKNKRRLIRALEIVIKTKKAIPLLKKNLFYRPILMLGISVSKKDLEERIKKRVQKMFRQGLKKEVKNLIKKYNQVQALQVIGYQEWPFFVKASGDKKRIFFHFTKNDQEKIKQSIILHTKQFAKRQITWFKRDKRIHWIKNEKQAEKLVKAFLLN